MSFITICRGNTKDPTISGEHITNRVYKINLFANNIVLFIRKPVPGCKIENYMTFELLTLYLKRKIVVERE